MTCPWDWSLPDMAGDAVEEALRGVGRGWHLARGPLGTWSAERRECKNGHDVIRYIVGPTATALAVKLLAEPDA